ncbi:hypothetical protein HK098_006304, partial [Nowakowskiella sp. JEL0407]
YPVTFGAGESPSDEYINFHRLCAFIKYVKTHILKGSAESQELSDSSSDSEASFYEEEEEVDSNYVISNFFQLLPGVDSTLKDPNAKQQNLESEELREIVDFDFLDDEWSSISQSPSHDRFEPSFTSDESNHTPTISTCTSAAEQSSTISDKARNAAPTAISTKFANFDQKSPIIVPAESDNLETLPIASDSSGNESESFDPELNDRKLKKKRILGNISKEIQTVET